MCDENILIDLATKFQWEFVDAEYLELCGQYLVMGWGNSIAKTY